MSSAICFNLDQSKILLAANRLTLYHTIPTLNDQLFLLIAKCFLPFFNPLANNPAFLHVCSVSLLKTLFLLLQQHFLPLWRSSPFFYQIQNCCLQSLSDWKNLKFVVWEKADTKTSI